MQLTTPRLENPSVPEKGHIQPPTAFPVRPPPPPKRRADVGRSRLRDRIPPSRASRGSKMSNAEFNRLHGMGLPARAPPIAPLIQAEFAYA